LITALSMGRDVHPENVRQDLPIELPELALSDPVFHSVTVDTFVRPCDVAEEMNRALSVVLAFAFHRI